ncbi:MAG TPA: type II toxin-antitoxin system VapC family toxin [Desulfatiglandales bacterium]|nr:type II toxin-antitoxin system VapC family toxin [Desulfatiglandales bacterium]
MRRLVIDSSVSLKWWLDDEEYVAQAREILNQIYAGRIIPVVPDLWHYEVANGIRTAILRRRINKRQGKTFISELISMGFESHGINPYLPKVFDYAIKYKYAIYDFSYIVLAQEQGIDFVTGDERLLSTVREDLKFVYHLSTLSL